ncbi:hypothetical protein [Gymnodinialimonas ceratoperidinii]|uniref:von Hippel-Lindau disease tumour suppressor beta domain-containing protein n=1 Tax=Gymnodinialimonas ceratoperidinii TaxID=2856823 RepID=A0A8F6TTC4_9RHOB|nr:hypothetical protein [Gymnodinialimonas ceratoperidinii]QXT38113.1 hypothetical protein KYE46_09080 [Gymnodinialimonas ceratoperidinii]
MRHFLAAAALAALNLPLAVSAQQGGLTPDVGPAISGHDWARYTEVSDNVFETNVSLMYAVPETDDVIIAGQCFIGAQGPLISLSVSADISGMSDGDAATMLIRSADGREAQVEGSVVGTMAEVGISGVDLTLRASDPAWLVIAGSETVSFERVGSSGGYTITGNGPDTIGPFLADCDGIGDLTPESGSRPTAPSVTQSAYLSCDNFGRVASQNTNQSTVITFHNQSGAYRALLWIDGNGNPVEMGGMNAGEQISFDTDLGHVWMATDGPGNCFELIQPVAGEAGYVLTAQ